MSPNSDAHRGPGSYGAWYREEDLWLLEDLEAINPGVNDRSAHTRRAIALYLGVLDACEREPRAPDPTEMSDRALRAWVRQAVLDEVRRGD